MSAKKTTEQYIKKAMEIHGEKYDYSNLIYSGKDKNITFKCKNCNTTCTQNAGSHIHQKQGCRKCSYVTRGNNRKLTIENFILRAHKIHSELEYTNLNSLEKFSQFSKIHIFCKQCKNNFTKVAKFHLAGEGCNNCARARQYENSKLSVQQIQERIKNVHGDKYTSNLLISNGVRNKIIVNCKKNHTWSVTLGNLIYSKHGCPYCSSRRSIREISWLNSLNIDENNRQKRIPNTRWFADALVGNTIYEFYGAYYHGDPRHDLPTKFNKVTKSTYLELYDNTISRQSALESLGYNVKFVWELDWLEGKMFSDNHPKRWSI